MAEEWDADRKLDSEDVKRTLKRQFPELPMRSIMHLGSGWDFDAYLVDKEVVFRFPRRAEIAEFLENEEKILSLVVSRLRGITSLPEVIFRGQSGKEFPYPFLGHRLIDGVAADDQSVTSSPQLATDLGNVLTAIHSISVGPETNILYVGSRKSCEARYRETLGLVESNRRIQKMVPEAFEWLCCSTSRPLEYDGPPCFVHNDFCPDHIIVNPDSGRLTGIIDWSDAAFGDPVWDFVGIVLWEDREFVESVITQYGRELDVCFRDRLRFLARTSSLKWLSDVIKENGDIKKHVRWVENAFAA